jgi:hypothetical protein
MNLLARALMASATSVALFGCSTLDLPISTEASSQIKRVAVISKTANILTIQHRGFTRFGNSWESKDISDWKLDAKYETQIDAALSRLGGFSVVKAPYLDADFSRVNANDPREVVGPNWSAIAKPVQTYCAANSLDAVFVVARKGIGTPGVYSAITKPTFLSLHSNIALISCRTGKPLAVQSVGRPTTTQWGGAFRAPLADELPKDLAPREGWTPEISENIKVRLEEMPAGAWEATIAAMFPR